MNQCNKCSRVIEAIPNLCFYRNLPLTRGRQLKNPIIFLKSNAKLLKKICNVKKEMGKKHDILKKMFLDCLQISINSVFSNYFRKSHDV